MNPSPQQPELLSVPAPLPGSAMVNPHVCVQTEGSQRVILVHGIVFSHYSTQDRAAEAYAMVTLFHPGPPFKSPVNTRLFSLFPFSGISLMKPFCQPFVNFRLSTSWLAGCYSTQGVPRRRNSYNQPG